MLRDLRFVHNAAIILMLALSIVGSATAQEADEPLPPVSIPSTEAMHMTATASGHDFVISVGLPWNYKFSEDRFPLKPFVSHRHTLNQSLRILKPALKACQVTNFTSFANDEHR